ncbi:ribosomal RNA processing protein [Emmonsiellopsis sp. PD_5]|nr:ribosomal RNA processing protein [Emmonsiellopsis sp. PD_5]
MSSGIPMSSQPGDMNPPNEAAPTTFKDLGILDSLCETCDALGYKVPTPIQALSIPKALEGQDLIGLAETGSGKTAAFVLPTLQASVKNPQPLHTLILTPTRERALQIDRSIDALGAKICATIFIQCALLTEGVDMLSQAILLGTKPHVVVATPERLLHHLEKTKGFSLQQLKYLVLDETDRMLDLNFRSTLDKILRILPGRTTFLFSATLSSKVELLQRAALSNPVWVSTKSQTVSTALQSYIFTPLKDKDIYLVHLLNERAGQTGIIFTRTIKDTQRLTIMLQSLGFLAIPIHSHQSQDARRAALCKFWDGARNLLIASEVAARGLDILVTSVDLVINYDLPSNSNTYFVRTALAGRNGIALSFVTQYDVEVWGRIEDALGKGLDELKMTKNEAMMFAERVGKAGRIAELQIAAVRFPSQIFLG